MNLKLLERVLAARQQGSPAALVTDLNSGEQCALIAGECLGELQIDDAVRHAASQAIALGQSLRLTDRAIFIQVLPRPCRLVVIGAVHIAEPLVEMAMLAGYQVIVVDPRQAFTGRPAFQRCSVCCKWPEEALAQIGPDASTAIVTLSHDPKIDDPAMRAALRSPAFYIGALGSRRSQAKRLERLRREGFGEDALRRIHGPVGLAIGAVSPAEIAIAIVAEMTQVRRLGGPA